MIAIYATVEKHRLGYGFITLNIWRQPNGLYGYKICVLNQWDRIEIGSGIDCGTYEKASKKCRKVAKKILKQAAKL